MDIEMPANLQLSPEQLQNLQKELGGEVVDTARGAQAEAVTAVKSIEQSEVVKVQQKAKVTT
jgi:hypothetical protein